MDVNKKVSLNLGAGHIFLGNESRFKIALIREFITPLGSLMRCAGKRSNLSESKRVDILPGILEDSIIIFFN